MDTVYQEVTKSSEPEGVYFQRARRERRLLTRFLRGVVRPLWYMYTRFRFPYIAPRNPGSQSWKWILKLPPARTFPPVCRVRDVSR